MTPASDLCEAGLCVTFDNGVNIERPKGRFIEAANFINSNPACVVSINRLVLEAGALEATCKKICRCCRISVSFSALPNEAICSSVTELQFPTKLKEEL
jgi:hypothetical protein